MEEVLSAVRGSVAVARAGREAGTWSEEEHAMRLRTLHEDLVRALVDETPVDTTVRHWREGLQAACAGLLWQTPACETGVDVASAFNGAQLTGIVLCKLLYLVLSDLEPGASEESPHSLFAGMPEMQTATAPFLQLSYAQVCAFGDALQARLGALLGGGGRARGVAGAGVVFLCAMFGRFFSHDCMRAQELDDAQSRELVRTSGAEYRLSKQAARRATVLVLCLLREYALHCAAQRVALLELGPGERARLVEQHIMLGRGVFAGNLAPCMRLSVQRLKRRLVAAPTEDKHSADQSLWDNVVKGVGADRMGARPRKLSAALRALLQDICVVLHTDMQRTDPPRVTDCFVRVLVGALQGFYIVPSAGAYRTIQQLEELLPGQRLGYAFDHQHFDTGQLSQVIFFHNPVAKQLPPPTSVASWDPASAAGPVAAFMQLDQQVRIHGVDVQDPLGVRGEQHLVARPADALPAGNARRALLFGRGTFMVSAAGTYLVDRHTHAVFGLGEPAHAKYRYLVLVAQYVLLAGLVPEICGVAVNSCKLATSPRDL